MKNFKKITIIFLMTIIFILIPSYTVFANDNTKNVQSNTENKVEIDEKTKKGLEGLYDYINKMKTDVELLNELDPGEYIKTYIETGQGNIGFSEILKAIISLMFREIKVVFKLVVSVVAIAILCALLKNLQDAFSNKGLSNIAFFACYAVLIIILTKSFLISIDLALEVIKDISNFMNALLPVLVTMIALAGGFTQAATLDPIILASVILIPKFYNTIIIPLILLSFVLKFANNLSNEHKIDNLCKLVSRSVLWIQGITLTIFIATLTIRGITAETIDAVALKTTKFAVDNFIPIVGKTFSDAITSVAGYSLIIKNAITGVGLVVIVLILLYPIVKLVILSSIYKISAAVIEPITDKRITESVVMVGDSIVLLMSCVITISFMFFILLGVMASAGKFVVGG